MSSIAISATAFALILAILGGYKLGNLTGRAAEVIKVGIIGATAAFFSGVFGVPMLVAFTVAVVGLFAMGSGAAMTPRFQPSDGVRNVLTVGMIVAIVADLVVIVVFGLIFMTGTTFGTH